MLYNMLNNILFLRMDSLSTRTGQLVQLDWTACPLGLDSYILVIIIMQGGIKVVLELSNKNSDHCSQIQEVQLRKVSTSGRLGCAI